jgi:hypothetical protein
MDCQFLLKELSLFDQQLQIIPPPLVLKHQALALPVALYHTLLCHEIASFGPLLNERDCIRPQMADSC